jgi:hypothetical protein
MSRKILAYFALVAVLMIAGCAKRNTAYEESNALTLLAQVPVVGNPCDMSHGGGWLYVALDLGGLALIDTQSYETHWYTSIIAADSSLISLNSVRLVDCIPENNSLYVYDTTGTDDITFINTENPESLLPYGSIRGESQNIRDMIWRKLENDPSGNNAELLYALSGIVHYGRNDGGFWMGNEFNITVDYPITGLEMDAQHVYVATGQRGLFIYSRANQQLLSEIAFYGYAQKLVLNDGIAYVAARHGGLQIVNVDNPNDPKYLGGFDTVGYASDLDYHDGKVAISSGGGGLYLFDVSDPANPILIQRITECGYVNTVLFKDDVLIVGSRDNGIYFYQMN